MVSQWQLVCSVYDAAHKISIMLPIFHFIAFRLWFFFLGLSQNLAWDHLVWRIIMLYLSWRDTTTVWLSLEDHFEIEKYLETQAAHRWKTQERSSVTGVSRLGKSIWRSHRRTYMVRDRSLHQEYGEVRGLFELWWRRWLITIPMKSSLMWATDPRLGFEIRFES